MADSNAFYDSIAATYDAMIPFDLRFTKVATTVEALLEQAPAERALDVATGTGLYALALAKAGVETTGTDLSSGMIAQARERARAMELSVEWHVGSMQRLGAELQPGYDLILCLGNSLPHLLTRQELDDTLASFATLMAPGGRLLLQLLNYQRVLAERERIVAITRSEHAEYVRFYDFQEEHLHFNVLRIAWSDDGPTHELSTTTLHPWQRHDLTAALEAHGFHDVEACANLLGKPFDATRDQALVLRASR